ncbi:hypothetical protein [Motilimonas sp. KMU-193]|uniref:hypothetical protein n=1 Tax=Motilimonas sp. KMU-193 TaxID=3388668 RepID=UPI00396B3033
MCGYCIESGIVLDYVASQRLSNKLAHDAFIMDSCGLDNYLQEAINFPEVIDEIKQFGNFPSTVTIALCRMMEDLINQGYSDLYHDLATRYGEDVINEALARLKTHCPNEYFKPLCERELYLNQANWEHYLSNVDPLVEEAERSLNAYLDSWIKLESATRADLERFYNSFPQVFFAYSIIKRYNSDADIVRKIALANSLKEPDFSGYDLWLQRKAFVACVQTDGVEFVMENCADIRLELVYYALLKDAFASQDRELLKKHLLSHQYLESMLDPDAVVELINNL